MKLLLFLLVNFFRLCSFFVLLKYFEKMPELFIHPVFIVGPWPLENVAFSRGQGPFIGERHFLMMVGRVLCQTRDYLQTACKALSFVMFAQSAVTWMQWSFRKRLAFGKFKGHKLQKLHQDQVKQHRHPLSMTLWYLQQAWPEAWKVVECGASHGQFMGFNEDVEIWGGIHDW